MLRRSFLKSLALGTSLFGSSRLAKAMLQAENRAGAMPQRTYPALAGPFRLSADWYRNNVTRLQQKLREAKLAGAIVSEANNVNYLTGAFATTTERPLWMFVPANEEPAVFYPGLDRDLFEGWWIKRLAWYFDFPHHGSMNQVVYEPGPTTDLFAWVIGHEWTRALRGQRVGFDQPLSDERRRLLEKNRIRPDATLSDVLLKMRIVKTPEEIELAKVSIELHDRMLEFGRDYILTHVTDTTDFDVAHATRAFGTQELMRSLKLDGRPHTGVGIEISFSCRTGEATAYPHPNQFFYRRIQRGDAIQIATSGRVGGYGGEGYRAMQIMPAGGKADPLREKLWETHTAMTLEQQKLMKPGVKCNEVGSGVLKLAREAGLEKYIYHRPAHGEGAEGHQAPYLSLGDNTVLVEGMTFSNEPGLYNPEGGYGYNHSNLVLVTKDGGKQLNRTPLTKEWCWLSL